MKVSIHSQREYERKIRHLEQRLEKSIEKNQKYSAENKYFKKRIKVLLFSRDNWKRKNRYKREKIKRLSRNGVKVGEVRRHHYPLWLISLCIKLRVEAGCTYRGICKVLLCLQCCFLLQTKRIPCANTVENWVSKTGYYCLGQAFELVGMSDACVVVDESVQQGNERVLLMLVIPLRKEEETSLGYKDVRICYLGGKNSWTGEKIKEKIDEISASTGMRIKAVLSDEDSKLLKATRLLGLPHLPDINHALASCLRKTFEKNEVYQAMIRQISSYQARSVNQSLSYLRPPKQRIKARFMNLKGIVKWGLTVLEKFGELNEKEKTFFAQLPNHQPMLETLGRCIDLTEKMAKAFKSKGLSKETLKGVENIIRDIKNKSGLTGHFLTHVESYLEKYRSFLGQSKDAFNISSDIIESLFGRYKNIKATNTLVGVSQLDLELPVYCRSTKWIAPLVKAALESTFMTDLTKWINAHSSDNQAYKRKKMFEKRT